MELKGKSEEKITMVTHIITLDGGQTVTYKEFLNDSGHMIDCELRDEVGRSIDGFELGTPDMLESIQKFLDDTEGA